MKKRSERKDAALEDKRSNSFSLTPSEGKVILGGRSQQINVHGEISEIHSSECPLNKWWLTLWRAIPNRNRVLLDQGPWLEGLILAKKKTFTLLLTLYLWSSFLLDDTAIMEVFKTVFSFFPTKGWLVVHTLQRQRVQKIMFYIEISSRNMCVRKKNTHQKKRSIPDVQSFWIFSKEVVHEPTNIPT